MFYVKSPLEKPARITSWFGWRTRPKFGWHSGVDYAVPTGTPILACYNGVVDFVGWRGNYGLCLILKHPTIGHVWSLCAHLSKIGVRVGDKVKSGTEVAKSGNTGFSTGPHLHFELRQGVNGIAFAVNPLKHLGG